MRNVTLSEIYRLRFAGLIGALKFHSVAGRARDDTFWSLWALRALLALGVVHVLCGIIFFFAYNWSAIPPFGKFALIEAGLVGSLLSAIIFHGRKLVAHALLITASVLVGVLFAVIGQVYQTGADAYELFATWALLILPWTFCSRSATHWLLWLVVAYTAFCTFIIQVLFPMQWIEGLTVVLLLGVFLAIALALREVVVHAGFSWMAPIWTRYVMLFASCFHFSVAASAYVFGVDGQFYTVATLIAALAGWFAYYHFVKFDLPAVSLIIAFGGLFLILIGWRLVLKNFLSDGGLVVGFAIMSIWCVMVAGGGGKLLFLLREKRKEAER